MNYEMTKELFNLLNCLQKQDKDKKPILYYGRYFQKVILDNEEYQKMCKRIAFINLANFSKTLVDMELLRHSNFYDEDRAEYIEETKEYINIKNALIKAQEQEKALIKITNLNFKERKEISQEYINWCSKNNVVDNVTNMITWLLCIKLKEVLENE